jgi:chromate transporter
MMEKTWKNYFTLFRTTFLLSAFTFGGGFVIISLMKKRFVDDLGWLEEEEMLNMAALAQSAPGPVAVNASILVGYRLMGLTGAVFSIVGTVLPPLIILSVISLFYTAFRDNEIVRIVLKGMMAGVGAVIMDVVLTMAMKILKARKVLPVLIVLIAFVAYFILDINVIYLIFFFGTLGALVSLRDNRTGKEHF